MGVEPHKVRRSTLVLGVVFVAALVTYLFVRPEPLPPEYVAVVPRRSVPAVTVPTAAPTTTRVVERPVSTTTATTQVVETTTSTAVGDASTPETVTSVPDTSAPLAPTTTGA